MYPSALSAWAGIFFFVALALLGTAWRAASHSRGLPLALVAGAGVALCLSAFMTYQWARSRRR
jgi:hypothetical protein